MAESVTIYGSIVEPPKPRYTKDGTLVVHFRLVQDDRYDANRGRGGDPDWQDYKPGLFMDVSAFRQEWLAESDVKPGDRVAVRGVLRQEKDYPHRNFDAIKAATGDEVWMKGGVKMEAREVLVSTAKRIVSVRNPYKDGTATARRQQPGGQQPGGQQPGGQQQGPPQGQQAPPPQQGGQNDPWAQPQHSQQAPQGDPWAQGGQQPQDPWAQGGQQAPQGDPWASHQG